MSNMLSIALKKLLQKERFKVKLQIWSRKYLLEKALRASGVGCMKKIFREPFVAITKSNNYSRVHLQNIVCTDHVLIQQRSFNNLILQKGVTTFTSPLHLLVKQALAFSWKLIGTLPMSNSMWFVNGWPWNGNLRYVPGILRLSYLLQSSFILISGIFINKICIFCTS